MDRKSEIRELSAADIAEVSGGSQALVQAFLKGVEKGRSSGGSGGSGGSRSDLGQQLQLALQEANNIY